MTLLEDEYISGIQCERTFTIYYYVFSSRYFSSELYKITCSQHKADQMCRREI